MHLMILIVIFAVTGMTFTFGMRSGMINVAAASFWGIGAYATGLLMTKGGMTFWQALPLSPSSYPSCWRCSWGPSSAGSPA